MKSLLLSDILSGLFNTVSIFNFNEQMKSMLIVTLVLAIIIIILGLLIRRVDPKKKTPLCLCRLFGLCQSLMILQRSNIGKKMENICSVFPHCCDILICT